MSLLQVVCFWVERVPSVQTKCKMPNIEWPNSNRLWLSWCDWVKSYKTLILKSEMLHYCHRVEREIRSCKMWGNEEAIKSNSNWYVYFKYVWPWQKNRRQHAVSKSQRYVVSFWRENHRKRKGKENHELHQTDYNEERHLSWAYFKLCWVSLIQVFCALPGS